MICPGLPGELPMNYANIKYFDIADGEGVRTSLFVSGCRRGCKNCFTLSRGTLPLAEPFDSAVEDKIIESLDHPFIDGLTILGGEPMEPENQAGLVDFIERVRAAIHRGRARPFGALPAMCSRSLCRAVATIPRSRTVSWPASTCWWTARSFRICTISRLRFRGSSNQRVIDMNATRTRAAREGVALCDAVELWRDDPVYSTHTM